jgi:CBS domain-containing protein/signal transduction histidine kinase
MKTLKHIANTNKFEVNIDASIKEAMAVMYENKNGCVVILDENIPKSIITESDIVLGLKNKIDLNSKAINLSKKDVITANENLPVDFAFDILSKNNIRRVVLIDINKNYKGIVLQEDLFEYLEDDVYKVDLKITDILSPNQSLFTVDEKVRVVDALQIMQEHFIGSILITKNGKLSGIITEKDILKLTFHNCSLNSKITEYMTSPVITTIEDVLVTDALNDLKKNNIRRIIVLDKNENLKGILTNRDILKHIRGNYTKILQNKIKHAQEIMDFLPEPIIEVYHSNNEDIIYSMNYRAKKVFGKECVDKNITKIIPKKKWKELSKLLFEVNFVKDISIEIDNSIYEISATISRNINTNYIKIIFKDVTFYEEEKNKLQTLVDEEIKKRLDSEYLLMQQSKLATMGEMVGHIAHQWRQPLAQLGGIFMNLESAYEFNEMSKEYMQKKVDHGNEIIKYMSKTIEDFRYFFEPNIILQDFNLYKYLQNAIDLIEASLTYNHIQLDLSGVDKELVILGYGSEFSQVVLNLLVNAKDALIENKVANPFIKIYTTVSHSHIYVNFYDNGGGIKEELIDKIFDNYFTTKSNKKGSGLGLYMSKLIIENKFNGAIFVKNECNGVLFTIKLDRNNKEKK